MPHRTRRQSLEKDLEMYRSGSPKWRAAREKLRALEINPKAVKKVYKGDNTNYNRKYGMYQSEILAMLDINQDDVRQYHKNGTLKRMIKIAKMRLTRQKGGV